MSQREQAVRLRGIRSSDEPPPATNSASPYLLLVEDERSVRLRLENSLTAEGFAVTTAHNLALAERVIADRAFAYAVIDIRLDDGNGLDLVRQLQKEKQPPRIIVITGHDSLAGTIVALRAGAVDYLPKPVDPAALLRALRGEPTAPSIPTLPLSAERLRWEYIQRVYEQCSRNVSEAARRLGMHRRTLQRILGKRAPRERR
jgi:two-component system, response regulator RegA